MAHEIQDFIKKHKNRFYLICFSHRSGSTHLCSLVHKHGLGTPMEYYYPCDFNDRCSYWNKTLGNILKSEDKLEYFKSIFNVNSNPELPTGIKISWDSLVILLSEIKEILLKS